MTDKINTTDSQNDEYKENLPNIRNAIFKFVRTKCRSQILLNCFPILKWLPKYKWNYIIDDTIAGTTVALMAIPQSLADAAIAGMAPQYGLYSSYMSSFVYIIFGTCKDLCIGSATVLAAMISNYTAVSNDFAILATFLTGVISIIVGILNLGFIVQFISIPVTDGFITSAAIIIASRQVKSLFGYEDKSTDLLGTIKCFVDNISNIRVWDTLLGFSTMILIFTLKQSERIKYGGPRWKIFFKYVSLSRNCIVVVITTLTSYIFAINGAEPFSLTGTVLPGLPDLKPPPFTTVTEKGYYLSFIDMIVELGSTVFMLPLIAMLQNVVIAKAFSKGIVVDASQEMVALGLCNLCSSFVSSFPVTGGFLRTSLSNTSGAKTALGGAVTGVIVLSALTFLTETFKFIPRSALAGLIISGMYYTAKFKSLIEIWKTKKIDVFPYVVTVLACLCAGLDFGVLIGVGVNALFILYQTARPKFDVEVINVNGTHCLMITPDQSVVYTSAEFLRNQILRKLIKYNNCNVVIVNGIFIQSIDFTAAKNLKTVADDLKIQNKEIYFWQWRSQPTGVAVRLDQDFCGLFSTASTLSELINKKIEINSNYSL